MNKRQRELIHSRNISKAAGYLFITFAALGLIYLVSRWIPVGRDWLDYYRPASLALLSGISPYTIPGFLSPAWVLLPLIPLALLPANLGFAILFLVTLASFCYIGYRLSAGLFSLTLFLLSPPVIICASQGQIDGLASLGFILPPQIGLFFVLAKPQIGIAYACFLFICSWREGGLRHMLKVFTPLVLALSLTFLAYGFWPLEARNLLEPTSWNMSLWPYGIPVGLGLLTLAIRKNKKRYAIPASPFFAPYLTWHTWSVALLGVLHNNGVTLVAVVAFWALFLARYFGY